MKTTVTSKNQVSIPARIARKYGVRPGYQAEWFETTRDDEVVIRFVPDRQALARRLRGGGASYRGPGVDPIAELIRERTKDDQ